jgi:ribosome-associated protein
MPAIAINDEIEIPRDEVEMKFVRSSGPGGQHVNKASTAVELRFDLRRSASLPEPVKRRLSKLAGNKLSEEGILVIQASRFRSQKQNREDALERLADLVRRAAVKPRKRRPTAPSPGAKERRLREKRRRAAVKRERQQRGEPLDS